MRILFVNKFLYPNGGSETYIFKLGKALKQMGHKVSYFGMEDERNIVGNDSGAYTSNKEFRGGFSLSQLKYPFEIIYSHDAEKKIAAVLDDFKPDVVHLNNINFQLTPSVIYEIKKRGIRIVWTLHDYQLVCPNHSLYIYQSKEICERCIGGKYINCLKNKCLHGSTVKSALAFFEGEFYKRLGTYRFVDKIICPSAFLAKKVETRRELVGKCVIMHNFIDEVEKKENVKENYVLYFGRFDKEKGIDTLIEVCRELPSIKFVFAGSGELEDKLSSVPNIENKGFCRGEQMENLIRGALFTVYPSEWYENCPFSIMESQMYGVPVVGADIGGIPELVENGKTGVLFESGNKESLKQAINDLYNNEQLQKQYSENCLLKKYDTVKDYCEKLIKLYSEQKR